jgi:hypothetical protein
VTNMALGLQDRVPKNRFVLFIEYSIFFSFEFCSFI